VSAETSAFPRALAQRQPDPVGRRWRVVPYDQLSDGIGPLAREDPRTLGLVLVESPWKATRRTYHPQKLAVALANLRHFALEQAARGVAVRHVVALEPDRSALAPLVPELGLLRVIAPAERERRADLAPLTDAGAIEVLPHEGWLRDATPLPPACADAYEPGSTCPMTPLYRAFLDRHRAALAPVGRFRVPLAALRHRAPARRRRDRAVFAHVRRTLGIGRVLRPDTAGDARGGTRSRRASVERRPRRRA
jgi:deoxyribodipyrimidine photolyase-like uncharacterized protein